MKRAVLVTNYIGDINNYTQAPFDKGFNENLKNEYFTTVTIYRDADKKFDYPLESDDVICLSETCSSYKNPVFLVKLFIRLARVVAKHDLVYVKLFQVEGIIAAYLSVILNKKYYIILVGDPEKSFLKRVDLVASKFTRKCIAKLVYWLVLVAIWASNGTVFVSRELRKRYGYSKMQVVASESWLMPNNFSDARPNIVNFYNEDRPLKIIYVGRLVLEKGLDILLLAVNDLCKRGNKIELTLVGDGKDRYHLEKLANNIDLRVNFAGYVSSGSEQLFQLYRSNDVFILPSYSEGLPLSILEAQASKNFVIASNVGGIPEIVIHRKSGFLLECVDIRSIINAVHFVYSSMDAVLGMINIAYDSAKNKTFVIEQKKIYNMSR